MQIVEREREKYRDIWTSVPVYSEHSPGEKWVPAFLEMAQPKVGSSVLDAGCGSGKAAPLLHAAKLDVTLCDLTDEGLIQDVRGGHARDRYHFPFRKACLWADLRKIVGFKDWVYCTDVLEHIPTEFVMLTITRMLEVSRKGCFFSVTFLADNLGTIMGSPLHQTVQPYLWWKTRFQEMAELVEARDLMASGLFLVKPR